MCMLCLCINYSIVSLIVYVGICMLCVCVHPIPHVNGTDSLHPSPESVYVDDCPETLCVADSLCSVGRNGRERERECVCVWVRESVRERENKKKKGSA